MKLPSAKIWSAAIIAVAMALSTGYAPSAQADALSPNEIVVMTSGPSAKSVDRDTGNATNIGSLGGGSFMRQMVLDHERRILAGFAIWVTRTDPATGVVEFLATDGAGIGGLEVEADGMVLVSTSGGQLHRIDPDIAGTVELSLETPLAQFQGVFFGDFASIPGSDDVLYVTEFPVQGELRRVNVVTQTDTLVASLGNVASYSEILVDEAGTHAYVFSSLAVDKVELATGTVTTANIPGVSVGLWTGGAAWDSNGQMIATNNIGDLYSVDPDTLVGTHVTSAGLSNVAAIAVSPAQCSDGIDNDGDGLTDLDDPDCYDSNDDRELVARCSDGIDNDDDSLVDLDDPICNDPNDDREAAECQDGIDNDGDERVDADDPQCRTAIGGFYLPNKDMEKKRSCGLGFEVALLLPGLIGLRRLRRRLA